MPLATHQFFHFLVLIDSMSVLALPPPTSTALRSLLVRIRVRVVRGGVEDSDKDEKINARPAPKVVKSRPRPEVRPSKPEEYTQGSPCVGSLVDPTTFHEYSPGDILMTIHQ